MVKVAMDDFLTAKQVIEILSIDRTTLYRMLRENRITGVKVGSQWRFRRPDIECLLQPAEGEPSQVLVSRDILPLHCLQPIQEVFSDMIQVSAVTTDADGEPISQFSNPCRFCELILASKKGKAGCLRSWKDIQFSNDDKTAFATCHAGLNYAGANIMMDGNKVAKLIAGQFYVSRPDEKEEKKRVRKLAAEFGIDEKELLKAATEVTIMDKRITSFLGKWLLKVANSFATLGYERRELMNRLKNIAEMSKL